MKTIETVDVLRTLQLIRHVGNTAIDIKELVIWIKGAGNGLL